MNLEIYPITRDDNAEVLCPYCKLKMEDTSKKGIKEHQKSNFCRTHYLVYDNIECWKKQIEKEKHAEIKEEYLGFREDIHILHEGLNRQADEAWVSFMKVWNDISSLAEFKKEFLEEGYHGAILIQHPSFLRSKNKIRFFEWAMEKFQPILMDYSFFGVNYPYQRFDLSNGMIIYLYNDEIVVRLSHYRYSDLTIFKNKYRYFYKKILNKCGYIDSELFNI